MQYNGEGSHLSSHHMKQLHSFHLLIALLDFATQQASKEADIV